MGLFDKIKDVIGDVAPIVLPVAINAFLPGLGAVASGALGAGIGTLLQGGDAKDALKSAALGGGIGALKVGFLGKQGNFADNLRADFDATKGFFSQPLRESASTLVGGTQKPFEYDPLRTEAGRAQAFEAATSDEGLGLVKPTLEKDSSLFLPRTPDANAIRASQNYADKIAAGASDTQALSELQKELNPSVLQRFGVPAALGLGAMTLFSEEEEEGEGLSPLETVDSDQFRVANLDPYAYRSTMEDILKPSIRNFEDGGSTKVPDKYKGFSKLPEGVQQKISPQLAKKYAQGGVVGGLMDLSNQSRQMADGLRSITTGSGGSGIMTGMSPINNMAMPSSQTSQLSLKDMASLGFPTPQYMPMDTGNGTDQFGRPMESQSPAINQLTYDSSKYERNQPDRNRPVTHGDPIRDIFQGLGAMAAGRPFMPMMNFKDGGEVDYFPRRNGGIGPGEGSGTKDDVPAMLMDGEFVMTRDAVRAAGGGSIDKGIDNMYGLMRNLEARA
tara:strand:+ start:6064 stop:7569 length:1506 start_codon:yes stop_codon:yes gene_type:complete